MSGSGFFIGLIAGGIFVALGMLVAALRKPNAQTAQPTRRLTTVQTGLAPGAAFQALDAAPLGRFRLGDRNAARGVLVFVSSITVFSWGFFFPVFIRAGADGGSALDIGIQSRAVQWGPVVTKNHQEFVAEVERALSAAAVAQPARS